MLDMLLRVLLAVNVCLRPAVFLVFDVYDLEARAFWSFVRVRAAVAATALKMVPLIDAARRLRSKDELLALLDTRSQLGAVGSGAFSGSGANGAGSGFVEGVYLRIDDERDEWLCERAKVVRADFTREIDEHWTKQGLIKNTVVYDGEE